MAGLDSELLFADLKSIFFWQISIFLLAIALSSKCRLIPLLGSLLKWISEAARLSELILELRRGIA